MIRRALAVLVVLAGCAAPARAHPAPFSFLDLRLDAGRVAGTLIVHDRDAAHALGLADPRVLLDADGARQHEDALARILAGRLTLSAGGRPVAVALTALTPLPKSQAVRFTLATQGEPGRAGRLTIQAALFPYDRQHQTFVNVYEGGALRHQALLDARRPATDYYAGSWEGVAAVLATFVPAGIHHIAIGPDHVLFLVGLLLLGGSLARLGLIATAFTIGHSITLSLAVLGVFSPPAHLVEPAIALSLVLVGVDNLLAGGTGRADGRRDLRAPMAAVFGLVHGFGFASVLREFGLPPAAVGWSLFGFNVGVEVGQLALVVPLAVALAALRRQRPVAAGRMAMVGSVVVTVAGAYWFVQRVFFPEGFA